MSKSLVNNYIHIIFSTKYRQPFIVRQVEESLFSYLGATCSALDCQAIITGGHIDHVHILCMLSKKIALMKLLQEVKANSSKWIKTKDETLANFHWQDGYGAFSVSPDEIDNVAAYIKNQKAHHAGQNFQEEDRGYLKKYKIDYDGRYVWD